MDKKQKYIRITLTDFSQCSLLQSKETHFRSMEKYLEKNNYSYESDGKICVIYVDDKNDSMRLGLHFSLDKVEYFDGSDLLPLILNIKEKSRNNPKYVIFDNEGNKIAMRRLREQSIEEIKINCIEKREVIKKKILTKSEIEKAFTKGELSPVNFMNKCFIDRRELAKFVRK